MKLRTRVSCTTFLIWLIQFVSSEPISVDAVESSSPSFVSIFSPRMDFDQWKPLTGRGDPLRNDPTYDYEPPVLERVHYWADDTRFERGSYPDRKSEVLMLGVSSRKPSIMSRQPLPPRKHQRPTPLKFEDYTYKYSDHYPMTILVPPPPPPPRQKPSLYVLTEDKLSYSTLPIKVTESTLNARDATTTSNLVTSYALQESNLIYQSSTTNQDWPFYYNQTKSSPNTAISSDYAGWGPTSAFEQGSIVNETYNLIFDDRKKEVVKEPYTFYKPILSESPPPRVTSPSMLLPTFVPTVPPQVVPTTNKAQTTTPSQETTTFTSTETQSYYEDTTTEKNIVLLPTAVPYTKPNIVDMLSPMMSMPMIPDSRRPEDNLYAHASETVQVFKDHTTTEDVMKLEVMQTMQPPPISISESANNIHQHPLHINPHTVNNLLNGKPVSFTHDPYLLMRFTTPMPTTPSVILNVSQDIKTTTEASTLPMYLIIQGHSKVKTYGSKSKEPTNSLKNKIPRLNETNEVKHLHPIKQKNSKLLEKMDAYRAGRARSLKSLIDNGLGSIEIQEADLGIKYDISDGGDVPIEIYRKGIVDSEENYPLINKSSVSENRIKRQIDLVDSIWPFNEDTLEKYVHNFFNNNSDTGISGLISQVITGDSSNVIADFENEHEDSRKKNEDR